MKSTQTTVKQRVEEVLEIRLMGAEFADIVRHAAAQGWNCGERQLWNYVHKGDEILAKTLERDRTKLVNRHIAQRRALFARCMAVSDYSNARGVLKDEAELLGLYPGNGDELPPPAEPEPDWTPAERARAYDSALPGTPGAGSGVGPGVSSDTISRPPRPRRHCRGDDSRHR